MSRRCPLQRIQALTARAAALEADRQTAIATAVTEEDAWTQIGKALGVSPQAAHRRYRWLRHSPLTGETWHEPPSPDLNCPLFHRTQRSLTKN